MTTGLEPSTSTALRPSSGNQHQRGGTGLTAVSYIGFASPADGFGGLPVERASEDRLANL